MKRFLILATLIAGFGLLPGLALSDDPFPTPPPARDEEGHFVAPSPAIGAENLDPDASATEEGGGDAFGEDGAPADQAPSANDNPAAMAAEEAARAAELKAKGGAPQPVTLSAKLVDDGPVIPSGLAWRVYSADSSTNGDVNLVARSDQATAVLSLPPGEYLVQAAYGFAQTSDTVTVTDAPQSRLLVLDAGALRLEAKISGGMDIPVKYLKFEIYPQSLESDPRSVIVSNVQPGELVHLNAGIYHVVSKYGAVNAVAETDLRVDKGQLTEATLFHDAAQVSFRLVSEIGGEAIADVDWTIKDSTGATVYRYTGTFPSAILGKGDYTVLAQRLDAVYNRDFSVTPGAPQDIEVLTSL